MPNQQPLGATIKPIGNGVSIPMYDNMISMNTTSYVNAGDWVNIGAVIQEPGTNKTWYKVTTDSGNEAYIDSKHCETNSNISINMVQKQTDEIMNKMNKDGLRPLSSISGVTIDAKVSNNVSSLTSNLDDVVKNLISEKNVEIDQYRRNYAKNIAEKANVHMFGLPHQLTDYNDPRVNTSSDLGRMFTETFILDAPILYVKPGKPKYLPGMSDDARRSYTAIFLEIASGNQFKNELAQEISNLSYNDDLRYFEFEQDYATYMSNVSLLCRIGAVFMDLHDVKVPWTSGNVTYGCFDWRSYEWGNFYKAMSESLKGLSVSDTLKAFISDPVGSLDSALGDDKYVRFYMDADVSFSESASNSTTQSALTSFTDSLQSMGKEIEFVSGMSGISFDEAAGQITGGIDNAVAQMTEGGGALAGMFKRLTGVGKQLLAGSNFLSPDIWNDSDYGKNYSFTIHLATPYGTKEAWYLNIYVPLMHILGFALPKQTSGNTYAAPNLVQIFAPGWFSCDMGIVGDISIDKGGSGDAWSAAGYPNEIKVSISVKDLYSNLSLPDSYSISRFFNNTGLINFLMVNCGVNIAESGLGDKINVFLNLFNNGLKTFTAETISGTAYKLKDDIRKKFTLYK